MSLDVSVLEVGVHSLNTDCLLDGGVIEPSDVSSSEASGGREKLAKLIVFDCGRVVLQDVDFEQQAFGVLSCDDSEYALFSLFSLVSISISYSCREIVFVWATL